MSRVTRLINGLKAFLSAGPAIDLQIETIRGKDVLLRSSRPLYPGDVLELTFRSGFTRKATVTFRKGALVTCVLAVPLRRQESAYCLGRARALTVSQKKVDVDL